MRTSAESVDDATVDEPGVFAEVLEGRDQHAGRCGLAVGSGNRNESLASRKPFQRLCAVKDWDTSLPGQQILRIVLPQCTRDDKLISTTDMRRVVSNADLNAEIPQCVRGRRLSRV